MVEIKIFPKVEKRKLMASGSSVVLTVPKEWLVENDLDAGEEVMMIMNGSLNFTPITEENITKIRNHLVHATRPDDDTTGETREALVSPRDNKQSAIASGITSRFFLKQMAWIEELKSCRAFILKYLIIIIII